MTITADVFEAFLKCPTKSTSDHATNLGQGTLTPIGFGLRMSPGAEIGSNARWQQGGADLNLFYFFCDARERRFKRGRLRSIGKLLCYQLLRLLLATFLVFLGTSQFYLW